MVETSEDRRVILDLVLAGCICLAAACYWFWDTKTTPQLQPPAAITEAKHITRDPFNDEGYRLFSASDYVGAEAQFRKAISSNPKAAIGFCNLGAALIAQRRYDEAIAALRTASILDSTLALAQNNLHWALEEKAKNGH
jgi:Flp pilus assembly protein TadD